MSTPRCFINHHKWTNSIALIIYYEHFMLVGCITKIGSTGWEVHELERPGDGYIEISFDVAKILSFLIDPENPLSGDEEEKIKKNDNWCFITYDGNQEWISGLMPYRAYQNAREAGYYQTDYFIHVFNSFKEAEKAYKEITDET